MVSYSITTISLSLLHEYNPERVTVCGQFIVYGCVALFHFDMPPLHIVQTHVICAGFTHILRLENADFLCSVDLLEARRYYFLNILISEFSL